MKTLIRRLFFCILLLFLFLPPSYAQNYLYVSNPQATWEESIGVVNEATISVKPQGIYTEIGLFLTLSSQYKVFSPEAQLEIVYDFALPKNSLVTDSWLWVGDSIVKADIRDRWSASFIYEGIVQRQQDPSILYKLYEFDGRPVYQLRVYPLFEDEVRKVKITYLVPTTFSATGQNISLPMDMLTASGISPDNIRLLVWPDQDWQTPQLSEEGSPSFERKETLDGQPYLETELSEYFGRSLSLDFPSVLQEGIYLKTFQSAADNYYQLVYLPDLDEAIQPRSKTAFILDYVQDPTTVSREEYLRETSQFLLANLSPSDSFNVIYPTLTANQASNSWMAATEENIEQVMAMVGDRVRSDFSLLPSLLNTAFSFIGTDESAGIFLLASSDEFETVAKA
ncbi:MAG: VIT domain-containing protein, partial [Bacteroidota bacterium]